MNMKVALVISFCVAIFATGAQAGGYDSDQEDSPISSGADEAGSSLEDLRDSINRGSSGSSGAYSSGSNGSDGSIGNTEVLEIGPSGGVPEDFFNDSNRQAQITYQQMFNYAGYIAPTLESSGTIIDGEISEQIAFGSNIDVFIDAGASDGLRINDKFWVMHKSVEPVLHPITNTNLGYKIVVDGIARVVALTSNTGRLNIIMAQEGIRRGYKIVPYKKMTTPSIDPDKRIKDKSINGYVVTARYEASNAAQGDVVYFDVGASNGVEPGDVFEIIDLQPVTLADGSSEMGLPKVKGFAKILATRDTTSTALIFNSTNVVLAGDKVRFAQFRHP